MINIKLKGKTLAIPELNIKQYYGIRATIAKIFKEEKIDDNQELDEELLAMCLIGDGGFYDKIADVLHGSKYDNNILQEGDFKVNGIIGKTYPLIAMEICKYCIEIASTEKKSSNLSNTSEDTILLNTKVPTPNV